MNSRHLAALRATAPIPAPASCRPAPRLVTTPTWHDDVRVNTIVVLALVAMAEAINARTMKRSHVKTVKIRITCRQNPNGARSGTFFANVWDCTNLTHGGPTQIGHGEGITRREAIAAAKKARPAAVIAQASPPKAAPKSSAKYRHGYVSPEQSIVELDAYSAWSNAKALACAVDEGRASFVDEASLDPLLPPYGVPVPSMRRAIVAMAETIRTRCVKAVQS